MISYFDSSAWVKRYADEDGSDRVGEWLAAAVPATSRWTQVEILSAVSRRCREGLLTIEQRNTIAAALSADLAGFVLVEVSHEVVAMTDNLFMRHPLRAADCVQLASALILKLRSGQPVTFRAFDQRLIMAAAREGLVSEPP